VTEPLLTMTVDTANQPPIVTAIGEIDLSNVDEFKDSLAQAATDASAITVDISRVRYCDSAAIRTLFAVAAATALTLIVSDTSPIKTLLSISGLDRAVTVNVAQ